MKGEGDKGNTAFTHIESEPPTPQEHGGKKTYLTFTHKKISLNTLPIF